MAKVLLIDDEVTMVQMVAELLRHLSNAAADADLLHGAVDCLGDHVGGRGV